MNQVVSRAIGEELRRAREELPSKIGDRTLLSYEHGTRHFTFVRFTELCRVLEVDAPTLARQALQRARIRLESMPLQIDLHALLNDRSATYRPMAQWARNSLNEHPAGTVEVEPCVVRNLALFVGCDYDDLTNYLANFLPDDYERGQ